MDKWYEQPGQINEDMNIFGKLASSTSFGHSREVWLFGESWSNAATVALNENGELDYAERAAEARRKCRNAYIVPNSIFEAGINIKLAYTIGQKLSVGLTGDADADAAIEEFVAVNNFEQLAREVIVPEMMVDGEIFVIQEKEYDSPIISGEVTEIDAISNPEVKLVPLIGVLNSDDVTKVSGNRITGVNSITTNVAEDVEDLLEQGIDGIRYNKSEMTMWAYKGNFGELRGYPPFEGARQIADAMIEFMNGRLTVNKINSRLNMLHKHLVYPQSEKNGVSVTEQRNQCMASMPSIPDDGGVVHAFIDAEKNVSEDVSFLKTDKAATDARNDYEILRRSFAAAFGLADHMIGWGDSTNRATAEVISESVIKNFQIFQTAVRTVLVDVLRKMLARVYGPDKVYAVKNRDGQDVEVKADRLPIPIILPDLQTDSITEKIQVFDFLSQQGLSRELILEEMGYSPSDLQPSQEPNG